MKEGDCFHYAAWHGECKMTFDKKVLKCYRSDRDPKTKVGSWTCQNPINTKALFCGGKIFVIWDGKEHAKCEVLNEDCIAITHGRAVCKFIRMKVS